MNDRELLIQWNQRLKNVENFDTAVAHYDQLLGEIEYNERKILEEVQSAKKRMLKSIQMGEKLKLLKEHFSQLMEALGRDDQFFDFYDLKLDWKPT